MLCSRKLAQSHCSLCLHLTYISTTHTHTLFFIEWWQSMPKSNCITSLMSNMRLLFVLLLESSSPLPSKSQEDKRFTLRSLSCVTPSYLGQWCIFTLTSCRLSHDWFLSYMKKKKKHQQMRSYCTQGLDGAFKKTRDKHDPRGVKSSYAHLSSDSGWLMLLPPLSTPSFLSLNTQTHTPTHSFMKQLLGLPLSTTLRGKSTHWGCECSYLLFIRLQGWNMRISTLENMSYT